MMARGLAVRLQFLIAVFALFASGGALSPAYATPVIKWRVENPFRLFTDPADSEVHRATFRALGPEEKMTPILSAEQALQRRHEEGWSASMFGKLCWNGAENRYRCAKYTDYMNPESHSVIAEIAGLDEASELTCRWLTAPRGGKETRGKVIEQPCSESIEFEVAYPAGLGVKVEIGGREVLQTDIKVRDVLIVAMGDSFGSGEGNPDVPVRFSRDRAADYGKSGANEDLTGYPARVGDWQQIGDKSFIKENARWHDQACHRSLYSHQLRAALQLAIEDPHRSVTFVGLACSGAEVTFGLFLRYKGNEWVPNPPLLSQVSAAAEAQCGNKQTEAHDLPEAYHMNGKIAELKGGLVLRKCPKDYARKIDLVFVSIGGNDVGFSRLVANAVLADQSNLKRLGGWIGEVHGQAQASSQLARLDARYKSLNRALHNLLYIPWEESDRILLAGYPGMALTGDGSETCKDGRAGLEVVPDFRLSEQKLREGAWIGDKLHRLMRESSYTYGWTFVETHRRAFIDRGICSGIFGDGKNLAEELRMPRKTDGNWYPYNPADFRAYVPRKRWFRTPNDAFMTGNFHVAASLMLKVMKLETFQWFQLLLASTYSGAFHPTAEGHAAIADSVAEKARTVLQKYGQGPDPEPQMEDYTPPAPPADEPGAVVPDLQAPGLQAVPPGGVVPGGEAATGAVPPAAGVSTPPMYTPPAPVAEPAPADAARPDAQRETEPPSQSATQSPSVTPSAQDATAASDWMPADDVPATPDAVPPAGTGADTVRGTSVGEPDPGVGAPADSELNIPAPRE